MLRTLLLSWIVVTVVLAVLSLQLLPSNKISPILLLVSFSLGPIPILELLWHEWGKIGKGKWLSKLFCKFGLAMGYSAYYGVAPLLLVAIGLKVEPLLIPLSQASCGSASATPGVLSICSDNFVLLLAGAAALLVALASQQATFVNRLEELAEKSRSSSSLAAYYLVSAGFWAFSFAVPVTIALFVVYWLKYSNSHLAVYELMIFSLFTAGWTALIGCAIRRVRDAGDVGPPPFKRIDHVEIIPRDLEKAIDFYTNILGFKIRERRKVDAPPLEEVAYLQLNDTVIEVMSVKNAAPLSSEPWQVGYRMMAIEVEDMDKTIEYLKGKGVEISRGPVTLGKSKRAEIKDPDGLSIEIRQW